MTDQAEFEREVLRINERYNREFIEAFGLCPYAKPARLDGSSQRYVIWMTAGVEARAELAWAQIEPRLQNPAVEVIQFIFPLLQLDPHGFQTFGTQLNDRAIQSSGFIVASFHPELPYSDASPSRLVPFFRRSPDPLLQFVRLSVLEALKERHPHGTLFFDGSRDAWNALVAERTKSVTEQITDENFGTIQSGRFSHLQNLLCEIAEDRRVSYARHLTLQPTERHPG